MKLSLVDSKVPSPSQKSHFEGEQIAPMLENSQNKSEKTLTKVLDKPNKKAKKKTEKTGAQNSQKTVAVSNGKQLPTESSI